MSENVGKTDWADSLRTMFDTTIKKEDKPAEKLAKGVLDSSMFGLIEHIYHQTIGYELDKVIPGKNPGDKCVTLPSDAQMDRERKMYEQLRNQIESESND
jgi:hypothetical protein